MNTLCQIINRHSVWLNPENPSFDNSVVPIYNNGCGESWTLVLHIKESRQCHWATNSKYGYFENINISYKIYGNMKFLHAITKSNVGIIKFLSLLIIDPIESEQKKVLLHIIPDRRRKHQRPNEQLHKTK
jgi:hypothetical protein